MRRKITDDDRLSYFNYLFGIELIFTIQVECYNVEVFFIFRDHSLSVFTFNHFNEKFI